MKATYQWEVGGECIEIECAFDFYAGWPATSDSPARAPWCELNVRTVIAITTSRGSRKPSRDEAYHYGSMFGEWLKLKPKDQQFQEWMLEQVEAGRLDDGDLVDAAYERSLVGRGNRR